MTVSDGIHNLLLEKNGLVSIVTEQQERVDSLEANFTTLNNKYQLLKERQRADCEGTQLSNASMPSVSGGKRSPKIPDPPILDDGSEPTWEEWVGKMQAKLAVNEDHYPTEVAYMGYVLS